MTEMVCGTRKKTTPDWPSESFSRIRPIPLRSIIADADAQKRHKRFFPLTVVTGIPSLVLNGNDLSLAVHVRVRGDIGASSVTPRLPCEVLSEGV